MANAMALGVTGWIELLHDLHGLPFQLFKQAQGIALSGSLLQPLLVIATALGLLGDLCCVVDGGLQGQWLAHAQIHIDRKSTRLNSSHTVISYAVFCLKKKKQR